MHIYGKLDVPDCPDEGIIVMDIMRKYDDPKFETVGEVVDFFQQMFEVSCMKSSTLALTLTTF